MCVSSASTVLCGGQRVNRCPYRDRHVGGWEVILEWSLSRITPGTEDLYTRPGKEPWLWLGLPGGYRARQTTAEAICNGTA